MIDYNSIYNNEGMTYVAYRQLIDELLLAGQTTGPDDSEAMLHYTKMNVQRMNRVDKTVQIDEALQSAIGKIGSGYRLLVISEGWCGDAAQIVPVFDKLVQVSDGKLSLKLVLRDKNLPLIDAHLTNGGRAIPVLLVLDEQGEVRAQWGPRPQVLQQLLVEWKKENTDMMAIAEKLHSWYAKDKTRSTQDELSRLFSELSEA
ncbi:thioredoxin family protein [Pedobacter sp. GR22-6]|uniref:thioredoxin family protein n=1 Tax=Pedobacter sp. GR22-6 TaxID=3127957 RepID=UPI00307F8A69